MPEDTGVSAKVAPKGVVVATSKVRFSSSRTIFPSAGKGWLRARQSLALTAEAYTRIKTSFALGVRVGVRRTSKRRAPIFRLIICTHIEYSLDWLMSGNGLGRIAAQATDQQPETETQL